jgi:proline dehydrogenase
MERTTVPWVLLCARPGIDDALGRARALVDDGFRVALEHEPGDLAGADAAAEFVDVIGRVHGAGLASDCELRLPVDRLGEDGTVSAATGAGMAIVLSGPPDAVDAVSARLPDAGVVVPAGEPGAEQRCRTLAEGRVRLTAGRGAAADLAFVRCLNILMAAGGHPAVATADPRLIAVAGERAAWNNRTPDSWEHVMPHRVRTDQQRRLVAAGYAVRVAVPSGAKVVR